MDAAVGAPRDQTFRDLTCGAGGWLDGDTWTRARAWALALGAAYLANAGVERPARGRSRPRRSMKCCSYERWKSQTDQLRGGPEEFGILGVAPFRKTPYRLPEIISRRSQVKKSFATRRGGRTRLVNGEAFYGKLES